MNTASRTRPAWTATALLATAAILLTGCAGAADASTPAADGASGSSDAILQAVAEYEAMTGPIAEWPTVTEITAPPALQGKTVWYVPMVGGIPTMATIGDGVAEALSHLGAEVKVCDGQGLPTAVADCLRQARSQGAAAVVTAYVDYNIASSAFEELVDAGIPVVIGGVAPAEGRPADAGLAYFEQDVYNGAIFELAAGGALAARGEDTDVLWVRAMDTPTTQRASDMGIERFRTLCPECTIVTVDASTPQLDKLPSEVSAALVANADVNTVFVPMDAYVPTVSQGIAGTGRAGQLDIISTGADLAGLQRIEAGQQTIDLGVPPIFTGWAFANALVQHMAGMPVEVQREQVVRFFNGDNVTGLTLDAAAYASPDWYGDSGYEQNYLTAWGVD